MSKIRAIVSRLAIQLLALFMLSACAAGSNETVHHEEEHTHEHSHTDETSFDAERAKKCGADDYGMKQYVMAFLKRGPSRDRSEKEEFALQQAHMDNINRMAEEGKLVLAGPFLDDGELRGIYVFNVQTIEEAQALTESDPAVQAGSLTMELHPWYGSAALMEVTEIHDEISKIKF